VRWSDDYPSSWEPEEHVSPDLIAAFALKHPELFEAPSISDDAQSVPAEAGAEREAVGV